MNKRTMLIRFLKNLLNIKSESFVVQFFWRSFKFSITSL